MLQLPRMRTYMIFRNFDISKTAITWDCNMLSFHQMLLNLTHRASNSRVQGFDFSLGFAMHSNNQVDFPQRFAPEQRQMLFRRQAQPAVCHPNLPLTPCYAGRIPQMFSNRAMERGKHKRKKKKRLKILIRN